MRIPVGCALTLLAREFGAISEESFEEEKRSIIESILGTKNVTKLILRDDEGLVFGVPTDVEVDLAVKDDTHFLVGFEFSVSKGDVALLSGLGRLYEIKEGVRPRLLMVGSFTEEGVMELAEKLQVEIKICNDGKL